MKAIHRERARKVADAIEGLEWRSILDGPGETPHFSMETINYGCGSPACIAGWTIHLFPELSDTDRKPTRVAADILGLTPNQRQSLFYPDMRRHGAEMESGPEEEGYISAERAARQLRRYAKTGNVSWRATP